MLREARSPAEAEQWRRLFEALASPASAPALPFLGLRIADGAALRGLFARAASNLETVLAETGEPALDDANGVLAGLYAEIEAEHGGRLARRVFALGADGFPGAAESETAQAWEDGLGRLRDGLLDTHVLPAAKREVVLALVGHHLAAVRPLQALAAQASRAVLPRGAAELGWLVALVRWRRFARISRALARVLTPAEQARLVAALERTDAGPARSRPAGAWRSTA